MSFLATFLILGAIIALHEGGHFLAMRRNGVKVVEFSIGFGWALYKRVMKDGTLFALRLLPLGGYVRTTVQKKELPEHASSWDRAKVYLFDFPDSLPGVRLWPRIKISLAGPMTNALLAFLTLLVMYAVYGVASPAQIFLPPDAWDMPFAVRALCGAFVGSFVVAFATPVLLVYLVVVMGTGFFEGVAGPIGIFMWGSQAAGGGIVGVQASNVPVLMSMLWFFALLNGGIAGFNLMPVMPLDGGQVVMGIVRKIPWNWLRKPMMLICGPVALLLFVLFFFSIIAADIVKLSLGMY